MKRVAALLLVVAAAAAVACSNNSGTDDTTRPSDRPAETTTTVQAAPDGASQELCERVKGATAFADDPAAGAHPVNVDEPLAVGWGALVNSSEATCTVLAASPAGELIEVTVFAGASDSFDELGDTLATLASDTVEVTVDDGRITVAQPDVEASLPSTFVDTGSAVVAVTAPSELTAGVIASVEDALS